MSTKSEIDAVKDVLDGLESETPYTFALKYAKDELIRRFNEEVKKIAIHPEGGRYKAVALTEFSVKEVEVVCDTPVQALATIIVTIRKHIFGADYDEVKLAEIRKEIQNIRIESSDLFRDPTPKKNSVS